jgi:hypothetical protein
VLGQCTRQHGAAAATGEAAWALELSLRKIARAAGVSVETVRRTVAEHDAAG